MISKVQTQNDCLASFEALPVYMIGGTEENHAILQLIQALSEPKFETWPTQIHRIASAWLETTYGQQKVAVTSLAAAADEAS
jgi:hypothetical protein